MRFIHLGDCHLDAPLCDLGRTFNYADLRRHEIKNTFSKAIDFAKEKGVDCIFISGDLFEHKYVNKSTVKFLQNNFSKIPHIKIFISPGNHDPIINNSYYNMFKWPDNVYVFKDFQKVFLPEYNINVWGVGFDDFYVDRCMIKEFDQSEKDKLNILVAHGVLTTDLKTEKYHPIDPKYLTEVGFDYCALGHIHKPYIDSNAGICYPGSLEPLGFDETGEHGFIYGEVLKDYREIQFVNASIRQYFINNVDVSAVDTLEDIIVEVERKLSAEQKDGFNKIQLIGTAEDIAIDTKIIEEHFKEYYYIKVIDNTDFRYKLEEISAEKNLKGLFVRRMNVLINKAEPKDREMLEKALKYGLDAMTKGEVRF